MSPRPGRIALWATIAYCAACRSDSVIGPGKAPFHLSIERVVYAPGETARGALYNDGTTSMTGYSFCSGSVDRRTSSGSWESVDGWAYPCALIISTLAPGDSARWQLPLPVTLQGGTYRLRFFEVPDNGPYSGADDWRSTPPFAVTAVPAMDRRHPISLRGG